MKKSVAKDEVVFASEWLLGTLAYESNALFAASFRTSFPIPSPAPSRTPLSVLNCQTLSSHSDCRPFYCAPKTARICFAKLEVRLPAIIASANVTPVKTQK